ncbi:hypothetical protein CNMCM5623_000501 [Aspergillus felis]|uniref:Uncharacterized protein n=1 Tax=Aspergillus felis TaxID=1287682 RepID=A0A8H6Q6Y9_9EURO|nr:hypothetical protein CNMCM5623_000501 [Aspergillus felis]
MYQATGVSTQTICEDCYWEHHYGDPLFTKQYKHSIVSEVAAGIKVHMLADVKYLSVKDLQKKLGLGARPTPLAKVIQNDYKSRPNIYYAASRSGEMRLVGDEWLYKDFVQENPWKNIRVAVWVGPLVIENGSKESQNGAGISLCDPIFGQEQQKADLTCLALCGEMERQLWRHASACLQKWKCFQAVLKQVVGTPFTGWPLSAAEEEIIELLVKASRDSTEATRQELHDRVKAYFSPWVLVYFKSIVGKLLNSKTKLAWDGLTNNRQQFYTIIKVPYGLTEEYIRCFHFGCYAGPDLIDSLHEYWFDWGGFNRHLYPNQTLFPWDCTEALHHYPVKCGACTLSKHVWAFPFDSWSIISLHLSRDKFSCPPSEPSPTPTREPSWINNRLTLLTALDSLSAGATAMSQSQQFQLWLQPQSNPLSDRIKLGGINRAQPYSHALEHRTHDDFFVARWVSNYQSSKKAYETMRDKRYLPRTVQERELVFWGLEEGKPPGEYPTLAVEYSQVPNANFSVSSGYTTGCGACGSQATATACGANCGASCGGDGGGGCGGGGGNGGGGGVASEGDGGSGGG